MPFIRPPVVRPRQHRSRTLPIASLIGASLLLPLLGVAGAAQAQMPPGVSALNIGTMDLETALQQVQQQRTQVQKQASSESSAANLAYANKLSAQLTSLRQQLQQNPRPTAEQKQQLAQVEQSLTALTKVTQALAQPAKQGQAASTPQEQQQLLQQIAQYVQSILTQSGSPASNPTSTETQIESKTGSETKTASGGKMTTAPESQSQEITRPDAGKSPAKPATTKEVMMHLAAGQGDGAAQAQAAIPPAPTAAARTADTPPAAPAGATPASPAAAPEAGAATTAGVAGVSVGTVAAGTLAITLAAAAAAAASSSEGSSSATQSALQQQQQQQAATAAQQQAFAYVTAGLVTPLASIPTSSRATYTGPVSGTLNSGASIGGTLSASVDFGAIRSGAPSIAGGITFNGNQGSTSFNLTLLGGYVGGGMSGTYAGQNVTGFIMNGQFFGPAAEQLAGAWSMQNTGGSLSASGTFKAKQ